MIPIKDFKEYISKKAIELQKKEKHNEKLKWIDRIYKKYKGELETEVVNELKNIYTDYLKYHYIDNFQFESLDYIEISEYSFSEYSINFIRKNSADIELNVEFTLDSEVTYDDYSSAWYDREDEVWNFVDTISKTINEKIVLPVSFEVEFNPPSGQEFAFVKFKAIDDNRNIKL